MTIWRCIGLLLEKNGIIKCWGVYFGSIQSYIDTHYHVSVKGGQATSVIIVFLNFCVDSPAMADFKLL